MQPRFLKPAQAEIQEIVAYLETQRAGLGSRFQQDLRRTLRLLLANPMAGHALTRRLRRLRLHSFAYNVIYVAEEQEIVIVAVAHQKRRPTYWRRRFPSGR